MVNKGEPVLYYLKDGPKRGFAREEFKSVLPGTELPPEGIRWKEMIRFEGDKPFATTKRNQDGSSCLWHCSISTQWEFWNSLGLCYRQLDTTSIAIAWALSQN